MSKHQHYRMPVSGFQETIGSGYVKPGRSGWTCGWLPDEGLHRLAASIGSGGHATGGQQGPGIALASRLLVVGRIFARDMQRYVGAYRANH